MFGGPTWEYFIDMLFNPLTQIFGVTCIELPFELVCDDVGAEHYVNILDEGTICNSVLTPASAGVSGTEGEHALLICRLHFTCYPPYTP